MVMYVIIKLKESGRIMDLNDVIKGRYLPYAEMTIIDRAVPHIDGFKPVMRKVLWSMYELGMIGNNSKKKCARIVGDCMGKYHPHGDGSIYQTLCNMTDKRGGFNAPFIAGQGNFGLASSDRKRGVKQSQMRYTEAGLTPLAVELFKGIKEDAVDIVDNFDYTEKEPVLLPVSFPNVIVNSNKGIAVGLSSSNPSYTLKNACLAVACILRGTIHNSEELIDALGVPDFSTGGTVHTDNELLLKLLKTGKATFKISGGMHRQGNDIVIDTVPISTTFEAVEEQLKTLAQTPDGREISDITNNIGLDSTGVLVKLKKGTDLQEMAQKIYRYTDVRSTVSFLTQIIWHGEPKEMSVEELISHWIEFSMESKKRVYAKRAEKVRIEVERLSAWEKIGDRIKELAEVIIDNPENAAKEIMRSSFGMSELQIDYILDIKARNLCMDKALKSLEELKKAREKLLEIEKIRDIDNERKALIASELEEIAAKYGEDRVTKVADLVPVEDKRKKKPVIPDTSATVFVTERGFVKAVPKLMTAEEISKYLSQDDKLIVQPIYTKLNDFILIYTYGGYCYKILVNDIEGSVGSFKQYIWDLVERKDNNPLMYVCAADGFSKSFTIIYGNGRGRKVFTEDVNGRSMVYTRAFIPGSNKYGSKDRIFIVPYEKFFMVTRNRKAAYGDISFINSVSPRAAFKIANTTDADPVIGFVDANRVNNIDKIDLTRYCKGYCVKITDEPLLTLTGVKPKTNK